MEPLKGAAMNYVADQNRAYLINANCCSLLPDVKIKAINTYVINFADK